MDSPIRFVSWAAVSSLPQAKKISLEDQLQTNRQHVQRHGGQVVAELVVPGESRSIVLFEDACRRIEAYEQLRQLIEQRAFDVLIYLDRSRLGRKAVLSMAVVELCYEAGILCYETENPPASLDTLTHSYDDMLIGAIKSVGAQQEIHKLVQRHRMGMMARIKKGLMPRRIPYGYRAVFGQDGSRDVVIDEDAAAMIRLIMDFYLRHNLGMNSIAQELNRLGYRNRDGQKWRFANVQGMFRLLWRYAGYSEGHVNGEHIRAKGTWEPILDEETVRAIEIEIKARNKRSKSVSIPSLFSRLVVCETHHIWMGVVVHKRGGNAVHGYVRCKKCKPARHLRQEHVLDALRTAIVYLQNEASRAELLQDLEQGDSAIMGQIEGLHRQVAQTEAAMQRADDAYVAGMMDAERYGRQVEKLTAQRKQQIEAIATLEQELGAQRFGATRQERLQEIANVGLDMLASDDVAAANAWLRRHFIVYSSDGAVTRVDYI